MPVHDHDRPRSVGRDVIDDSDLSGFPDEDPGPTRRSGAVLSGSLAESCVLLAALVGAFARGTVDARRLQDLLLRHEFAAEEKAHECVVEADTVIRLLEVDVDRPWEVTALRLWLAAELGILARRPAFGVGQVPEQIEPLMPQWLVPPTGYIDDLLGSLGAGDANPLGHIARRLIDDFPCLAEPPRWTQPHTWPVREGRPALYLGEIVDDETGSIRHYFRHHDRSVEEVTELTG